MYSGERKILCRPQGLILSADGAAGIQVGDVEDVALPLYQGAMIHQYDFCAAAYRKIEGKRGFKWEPIDWGAKVCEPQYLMGRPDYLRAEGVFDEAKVVVRDISASTNERTLISACAPQRP